MSDLCKSFYVLFFLLVSLYFLFDFGRKWDTTFDAHVVGIPDHTGNVPMFPFYCFLPNFRY
jgi:hypothetical protein